MGLSARLVQGLVTTLGFVIWQFVFEPMYRSEVVSRGGVYGWGEAFLGAGIVVVATIIVSEIMIRRLRSAEAN